MFHPDTQFLIDLWTGLAHGAAVPDRASLVPETLGRRLPRTMMVEMSAPHPRVGLAGDWVEALHAEPVEDRPLAALARPADQARLVEAAWRAVREGRPMVLSTCVNRTAAALELTLAPFRTRSGPTRLLGLYAPAGTLTLGADEPRLLRILSAAPVGEPRRASLSLAADRGRWVA